MTMKISENMLLLFSQSSANQWLLALGILSFPILYLFLLQRWKKKGIEGAARLPPSPPKLPIIGNLHQLGKLPHRSLSKLSQEFGPVLLLQLGRIPTLLISSADMAKEVLKTHDIDCCSRAPSQGPKRLSYNFLDMCFSPYSDYWRAMRKVFVLELLSAKRAHSLWHAWEVEVSHLISSLSEASPNPVDLHEKIFSLMDGILNMFAFGKNYGGKQFKNEKFQDVLVEAMKMLDSFSAEDFFPSVGWIIDALTGLRARHNKCFRNLDNYFQMVVDEHLDPTRPKPEHEDLVDVLLGLSKDENFAFHLTNDHIKAILLNTFIGGTDTGAVTMVWAMSELMANPRVMKKVQAEVRSCVGSKPKVDRDDLAKLKYLKMVVKETFRMHPAAPLLIPHRTRQHCQINANGCTYDIFPQTTILVNAFAIGRDPNSWKNPDEFYPERFEDSDIDFKGQHFELLPFGAGRRICPAIAMAVSTVEFTLANLLYCFDWEMPMGMKTQDMDMEEMGGITTHRKTPLCLVPIKYGCVE